MTIIELAIFVALPSSVAFCFVFPLRDAFRLAVVIGGGSAVISAVALFAFAGVFRLVRGRLPGGPAFTPWGLVATVLSTIAALSFSWHSRLSFFGIIAFAAVSSIIFGTKRWSHIGWLCLADSVVITLALHIFLRTTNLAYLLYLDTASAVLACA